MSPDHKLTVDEGVALLAATPLFEDIDVARLRVLVYAAEHVQASAGEMLVRQSDDDHAGLLLLDGAAQAWMDEDPSMKLNLARGALIGEGAMIAKLHHRMNVQAVDNVELLRFSHELFLRVCHEFPELGRAVMANYARRMATITSALHTLLPG